MLKQWYLPTLALSKSGLRVWAIHPTLSLLAQAPLLTKGIIAPFTPVCKGFFPVIRENRSFFHALRGLHRNCAEKTPLSAKVPRHADNRLFDGRR